MVLIAMANNTDLSLMPVPQKMILEKGKFRLDDKFILRVIGNTHPRAYGSASRMLHRLAGRTGMFFEQAYITAETEIQNPSMTITINKPGKVELYEDESYELRVTKDSISLNAETDIGALRGMETLLQLLDVDNEGYFFSAIIIKDAPRFPWRGLMIDGCRHFMPVDVLKRNLDGMAAVKLNVLHWHLTEDQGFRVESKFFPKLHELGSDGFYYTQEQIKDIIAYASDRGIRVVPEFDLPGHATSWLVAYPELASTPGPYKIERGWGIFDPTFNPAIEETYIFLDKFFAEMSQLFPDEYMHIGGDENNGKQWDANLQIQEFMKQNDIADNHTLQAYFNQRLLKILTENGKKMVGWEEILHPDMPKNIVIQSWHGEESLVNAAQMGYQSMLSRGYYIDLIQATDFHYLNDPSPEDLPLTPEQRKLILGGEATMWAEFVSPETVDSRIWPRTAAIAERFWSPADVKDVPDMYRRLKNISFRLEELGLTHEKNYFMLLRRLTNNNNIQPLKNLVDVIEPVKIYNRNRLRTHYSHSPLTRVVDAARPDAKIARDFRNNVREYVDKGSNKTILSGRLQQQLILWQNNHSELIVIINNSPMLEEIKSLSNIRESEMPEADWINSCRTLLEKAKEPRGQTELMIIPGIEMLIDYVAINPEDR
jgi:hexosaminidase